jgi:acetyl esterase/lipase
MSFLSNFCGLLKKLAIFVLIVAIAIPLRYGSIDGQYLSIRLLHSMLSVKHFLLPDSARPTLSADYRAFENILRIKPMVEQDPLADSMTIVKNLRSSFTMANVIPKPSRCQVNKEIFQHDGHSVDTYWIDYPTRKFQPKFDRLILYFHGGGYMLGDIHSELFSIFR